MASATLEAWLRLTLTQGVGGETQRALLAAFGLPEMIFQSSFAALRAVVGEARAHALLRHDAEMEARIAGALEWAEEANNHLLTLADADYPQALLTTADPPSLLYVKGRLELLQRKALAIVGSRNASAQGEQNASAFAKDFAGAGYTVVSGLALGIDTAAHHGALAAGLQAGSTIAVIGTGADRIYPARNQALARQIATEAVIVSEFPLGTAPVTANFPRRNRLIAGLAQGCLVVEAAAQSGSLITARLAAEAGREVFAIPGSIHAPLAKGCHLLIKQGAKLVESAADVLDELQWPDRLRPGSAAAAATEAVAETVRAVDVEEMAAELPDEPRAQLLKALGHDPCTLDQLIERSQLTVDRLLALLLSLELEQQVSQLADGRYQRLAVHLSSALPSSDKTNGL